jgi:NAD(P)-dependent dehydrogenase (short-subunit alcohol dehydrogenase family)
MNLVLDYYYYFFFSRYGQVNTIFLNAGILLVESLDFLAIFKSSPIDLFFTGGNVILQKRNWNLPYPNSWNSDQTISYLFAANVLGHYALIAYLYPYFIDGETKVIWTSSTTANPNYFSLEDPQHLLG